MSKKRDPLAVVINYVTTAPIAEVNQALTVIKEIVRSRQPVAAPTATAAKRKSPPHRKRTGLPAPTPLPLDGGTMAPVTN